MGSFIRTYKNADVCVAVSTPTGLITPIVARAEQRGTGICFALAC
jgi:pyruvate dehydrogenase E2 component (dihydrolipoamide acetyltransferase)